MSNDNRYYKMGSEGVTLKYTTFKSQVHPSFWDRLTELKLDVDKLNETVRRIWGYYSNKKPEGQNQLFSVDASSFNNLPDDNRIYGVGSVINKNTIEGFKEEDKLEILKNEGKEMMRIIKGKGIECPSLLTRFLVFSFANLKSYQYYYWFAFPAPTFLSCNILKNPENIRQVFTEEQLSVLCEKCTSLDCANAGFFLVRLQNDFVEVFTLQEGITKLISSKEWYLGFSDTNDTKFPSWPLRNFIALVAYHCPDIIQDLQIICLRLHFSDGHWKADNSIILNVKVNVEDNGWEKAELGERWVGWEKNERGKVGPRLANLKNYMDPVSLAESSVDLNLKLMKWQILPELNLDVIKSSKCLLIGAGTLGCAVARNLMSWGVRRITFIDYGTISYSNPVRQHLYKYTDTGKPKAETAAAALREIFPGMVSSGFTFSIPMPGHPVGESLLEETKTNVKKLEDLIAEHDVTFLLMDSRESRWLPTLVATAQEKLIINAALGFDSYLVMRHGMKTSSLAVEDQNCKLLSGEKLGCYFCSDVTAPGNSFKGRTLDQQCTVTRPGVSNMAGALAVELFASVLQHPLQGLAPAEVDSDSVHCGSLLGMVPHSIRGFVSHFQTVLPAVECFSSCVACSRKVTDKYKELGFEFVLKCLDSKDYLEELCGLRDLQNEPLMDEVLEYSDSEPEE